jgi:hypothetical protein
VARARRTGEVLTRHDAGAVGIEIVDVLEDHSGTTRRRRVRLRLADGAVVSAFVKTPSWSPVARALVWLPGLDRAEVGFYRDAAAEVPLRVPAVRYAQRDAVSFVLVLEDLVAGGARFGSLGDSLPASDVEAVLTGLARLHGTFWDDARLTSGQWPWCRPLVDGFEASVGPLLAPGLLTLGSTKAGAAVPLAIRRRLRHYGWRRSRLLGALDAGPRTLVHHDCHPGNIAWNPDGSFTLCDWQLVRAGPWASDVAYLLATALDVATRRANEKSLLDHYRTELQRAGVEPPPVEQAWREYVANLVYPLEAMVVTLAVGGLQPRDGLQRVIERAVAAVRDHDAFDVLQS